MIRKPLSLLAAMGLSVGLLVGCSTVVSSRPEVVSARGFPVRVANCGMELTFDKAPQQVVTIKSTSTELLLALGLGDKIVGRAFADGPVPPQWAKAANAIPNLSDKAPSQETVLAKEPDLVYAGWESNLSAETAGERDTLAKLGVDTYVSPAACKEKEFQPDTMTFGLLFDQFAEIGRIFGVDDRAAALVDREKKALASVETAKSGTSALWYSSGTDLPYVGAGIGAPQMVLKTLGLNNVAGGVADTWTSMSWEKIADENPDVIVLVDATWNSASKKIAYLENNPVTARLDAVKQHCYVTIPFAASEAGVRTVGATVDMSKQLTALGFGE